MFSVVKFGQLHLTPSKSQSQDGFPERISPDEFYNLRGIGIKVET
jgi:hypothetical protein